MFMRNPALLAKLDKATLDRIKDPRLKLLTENVMRDADVAMFERAVADGNARDERERLGRGNILGA